jgi:hypothetical protein
VSPSLKQKIEKGFAMTLRNKLKGNAPKSAIFKQTTLLDSQLGQAQVQIKNLHD